MRKRNGFTLIELLAVLALLSTISLVSVIGIMNTLDKRNVRECNEQKEMAIGAAKVYFSLLNDNSEIVSVSIDTLIKEKYISSDNASRLNGEDTVNINRKDAKYTYVGTNCK